MSELHMTQARHEIMAIADPADEGAPFRDWEETPLGPSGGFLIYRISAGMLTAVIYPVILSPKPYYTWEAPGSGSRGTAGDLLAAKAAAHAAALLPISLKLHERSE